MTETDQYKKLSEREKIVCPFCNTTLANDKSIVKYLNSELKRTGTTTGVNTRYNVFHGYGREIDYNYNTENKEEQDDLLIIEYITCPACKKISITVYRPCSEETFHICPKSVRKNFPEYVPEHIRQDYEEACLIADLSPKASATLSRRCIQGMIRDFWGVEKNRLCDEIDEAAKNPNVSELQREALHALRNIGNIGAHPERNIELIVDVEPNEAKLMISLIEFFIQNWYIKKHDEEEMMKGIINVADYKKKVKNPRSRRN